MKKLSIVVPTFNSEEYLLDLINDLRQLNNVEIIFSDDGSTDGTKKIIESLQMEFPTTIHVLHNKHKGASNARNQGILNSKTPYLMFVDADDKLLVPELQNVINSFEREADIIAYQKNDFNCEIRTQNQKLNLVVDILENGVKSHFNPGPVSKIYKTDFLRKNSIFFVDGIVKGEDQLFNINAILKSKTIYIKNCSFYRYRVNMKSVTHTNRFDVIQNSMRYCSELIRVINDNNQLDNTKLIQLINKFLASAWINDSIRAISFGVNRQDLQKLRIFIKQMIGYNLLVHYKFSRRKNILKWLLYFKFYNVIALILKIYNQKNKDKVVDLGESFTLI